MSNHGDVRADMFPILSALIQGFKRNDRCTCLVHTGKILPPDVLAEGKKFIESKGFIAAFGVLSEPDKTAESVMIISRNDDTFVSWLQNADAAKRLRLVGLH